LAKIIAAAVVALSVVLCSTVGAFDLQGHRGVHGGRRPKAAKERTRDGGTCVVPHAWSYVGVERQCNLEMMARMLLNGDFMFCAAFDFNELSWRKD
jgi:hypothetical protein